MTDKATSAYKTKGYGCGQFDDVLFLELTYSLRESILYPHLVMGGTYLSFLSLEKK